MPTERPGSKPYFTGAFVDKNADARYSHELQDRSCNIQHWCSRLCSQNVIRSLDEGLDDGRNHYREEKNQCPNIEAQSIFFANSHYVEFRYIGSSTILHRPFRASPRFCRGCRADDLHPHGLTLRYSGRLSRP